MEKVNYLRDIRSQALIYKEYNIWCFKNRFQLVEGETIWLMDEFMLGSQEQQQ